MNWGRFIGFFALCLSVLPASLAGIEIGQQAPEISLNNPSGQPINLTELKGNIVLIDFWASWCGPCRNMNPELVELYQQYATNGFEILSVSLDEDHTKWQSAIEQDELPWAYHGSDLKGWKSNVVLEYGVQALPTQFLIDRDGKIVALDLTVEDLGDELEHLLTNEANVYPKNASSKLFMNVYAKYEVYNESDKKVKKGYGDELDVSKLSNGKYNVVIGGKDHWFNKVDLPTGDIQFYPQKADKLIKMSKAVKYEVSNLKGEVVLQGSSAEIDVSKLHVGVYYLNMNGTVGKFLKK